MRVFVLCTGRCGSVTFARACSHLSNYTSGHEARISYLGKARLAYPDNHIEVDNRLSWLLGRLDREFGDDATYVHLRRNPIEVATSYNQRWHFRWAIMPAYDDGILQRGSRDFDVCADYVDTVTSNIDAFLKDKSNKMMKSLTNTGRAFSPMGRAFPFRADAPALRGAVPKVGF